MKHFRLMPALAVLSACDLVSAPAAPGATLPMGEYNCVWVGREEAFLTALSFNVTGAGEYASTDGRSRGRFDVSGTTIRFRGGPFDGQTGEGLQAGAFTIERKRCSPATAAAATPR